MCAIVDANVVSEVFGSGRPPAGRGFFDALNSGRINMVVGGKLTAELEKYKKYKTWSKTAKRRGTLMSMNDAKVLASERGFRSNPMLKSDDPHILGLAKVSGARLLYSKDTDLHKDFTNRQLLKDGKVYSTYKSKKFDHSKRELIRKNICPVKLG